MLDPVGSQAELASLAVLLPAFIHETCQHGQKEKQWGRERKGMLTSMISSGVGKAEPRESESGGINVDGSSRSSFASASASPLDSVSVGGAEVEVEVGAGAQSTHPSSAAACPLGSVDWLLDMAICKTSQETMRRKSDKLTFRCVPRRYDLEVEDDPTVSRPNSDILAILAILSLSFRPAQNCTDIISSLLHRFQYGIH